MSSYANFARRCQMRHDFADQFQVRYHHPGGESYDTWVSGEEVLARLRASTAEDRLRRLGRLHPGELRTAWEESKHETRRDLTDRIRDHLGDGVDAFIGGNPFGDSLADNVRGSDGGAGEPWLDYLRDENFRAVALELAWINLRGSFPDLEPPDEPDDWV